MSLISGCKLEPDRDNPFDKKSPNFAPSGRFFYKIGIGGSTIQAREDVRIYFYYYNSSDYSRYNCTFTIHSNDLPWLFNTNYIEEVYEQDTVYLGEFWGVLSPSSGRKKVSLTGIDKLIFTESESEDILYIDIEP